MRIATMIGLCVNAAAYADESRPLPTFHVPSTLDGTQQPCLFVEAHAQKPRPLLVALHPWSHGFNTFAAMDNWRAAAEKRNWHYLQPHFRGPNRSPEACGSPLAKQDILDAVDYVVAHWNVDPDRIYLAGCSGGGQMALVMAAHAPERWAAVSAWCPITDLRRWHAETQALGRTYYRDLEASCGGPPGMTAEVDAQYRERSSVFFLDRASRLAVDINAGIHDGHSGSVPIHHTIDAFNAIARAHGDRPVSEADINTLSQEKSLCLPAPQDDSLGRHIYLRRESDHARVTIFEGGHEGDTLADPACRWLALHRRGKWAAETRQSK